MRAAEAAQRRQQREAQRRQRELERRAKEQAKYSAEEQARLEVEMPSEEWWREGALTLIATSRTPRT